MSDGGEKNTNPAVNPHNAGTSETGVTLTSSGTRKGRPPKYNNCLDLAWAIEDYFEQCDDGKLRTVRDKKTGEETTETRPVPYTMGGLQAHLELWDGNWVAEYASRSDDFARLLKRACVKVEGQREIGLLDSSSNTIGSIFYLKARHGWRDTPEQQQSSGITVIIEGGGTARIVGPGHVKDAIDCDYQTVRVALPCSASAHDATDNVTE